MQKIDTSIQTFVSPQFGQIRTIQQGNTPYFCLADICQILQLSSSSVARRIDSNGKIKYPIKDAHGRTQYTNFINEPGLYLAIMASRKPEAQKFQEWVATDVLPAIRKEGAYVHATPNDTPESIEAKAHQAAQMAIAHLRQQIQAQNQELAIKDIELAEKDLQIEEQSLQLTAQQPSVHYAQALLVTPDAITINEMAKILIQAGYITGQNRLFQWLRQNHYLCSRPCFRNLPTQEYMTLGYFVVREHIGINVYGNTVISHTTHVTPKGQQHLLTHFAQHRPEQPA